MKKPLVSIIIVNYNGKELLKIILNSVKKSAFANYEVLVVDNNSSDRSQEFIKKNCKNVKLVINKKNLGYSGINSALKYCKGKYILFLNNDMEIDKDCIGNLVKAIKSNKNAAMTAPKLANFYDKNLKSGGTWVSRAFYNGHIKDDNKNPPREIPYLGVGLIKKDFVDLFGYLFDPDYFIYAEDLDLGLRIRLSGYGIIFVPDAVMRHMHAVTTKTSKKYKMTFLLEKNLLMTYFKTLSLSSILLFMPYVISMRLIAIIKDIMSFKFMNVFARLYSILWIILNLNLIYKKRKQIQKLRRADDKFILKVFSEKYLLRKQVLV